MVYKRNTLQKIIYFKIKKKIKSGRRTSTIFSYGDSQRVKFLYRRNILSNEKSEQIFRLIYSNNKRPKSGSRDMIVVIYEIQIEIAISR